jgi:hypothetical protein
MSRRAKDLQGLQFGRLFVLYRDDKLYAHKKHREAYWACVCLCGERRIVRSSGLTSGQYKSCGCLKRDNRATIGPRLGQFKKREGTASRNVFGHYKLRAKKKSIVFELTFEDFLFLCQQPCNYCGRVCCNNETTPAKEVFLYNGIDRVNSKLGYVKENCVPCCGWCNIAKFDLSPEEFILNCRLVASANGN